MKLGSKVLERSIRRTARSEMRLDKALWKDYRRHRSNSINLKLEAELKRVLPFLLVAITLAISSLTSGRIDTVLVGVSIYASATTIFRATSLRHSTLLGYDRAVLWVLPISDDDFVRHQLTQYLWSWVRAGILFFFVYLSVILAHETFPQHLMVVVIVSIVQSICGLAASMWLIAYFPRALKFWYSTLLYIMMVTLIWLPSKAVSYLWSAVLITPGGWISHAFAALTGAASGQVVWLVPGFALAVSVPLADKAVRRELLANLNAQTSNELERLLPGGDDAEEEPVVSHPAPPDPMSAISGRLSGERLAWNDLGWLDRAVGRWLSEREKSVAEFMGADDLGSWSRQWRTAVIISAFGVAVTFSLPGIPSWFEFLPPVAAAIVAAPAFGGGWWGFSNLFMSSTITPVYASFPLTYSDISSVMFKCNLLRLLAWSPLALINVFALAMKSGFAPFDSFVLALEIVLCIFALQPTAIVGRFSSGTNDSKHVRWSSWLLIAMGLFYLVTIIGATVAMFASNNLSFKLIFAIALVSLNLSFWWLYKLLYNRWQIDLLSVPPVR